MKPYLLKRYLPVCILIIIALAGCKSAPEQVLDQAGTPTKIPATVTQTPSPTDTPDEVPTLESQPDDESAAKSQLYDEIDPQGQMVTFWHPFNGIQAETLLAIIDAFNNTNQLGITVMAEYQGSGEDLGKKMLTFMNTGEAPDLVVANSAQAAAYFLGDALVEMDPLLNHPSWGLTAEEESDYYTGLYEQGIFPSFSNRRLSFPLFGNMDVLYYNADWLAELGYIKPPQTPGALTEIACSGAAQPFSGATAGGSDGVQFAVNPASFPDWVLAFGGKLFNPANGQYAFDKSASIDAMTFLQNLLVQGCGVSLADPEIARENFGLGITLFLIDSTDTIPNVRAMVQNGANFNWRISSLPHANTTNPVTNVLGVNASILKTQPETQLAAWLFLKYFTSPEVQAAWVQGTHTLPVRERAIDYLGDYFINSPAYQMTLEWLEHSNSEPALPGYQQVRMLTQIAVDDILAGEDVTTTLTELTGEANRILAEEMALIPETPDPWVDIDPSGQTITFWHSHTGERQAALEEIINEFNATNQWGITVIPERQENYGDIFVNLLPILGTETAPDLVLAYQEHAAAYYLSGGLTDLNSLVESSVWGMPSLEKQDFYPGIYAQDIYAVLEGVRLGFPIQRSVDVLYYNLEWLAELGFDVPPTTLEEFKEMACASSTPFSKSTSANSLGYNFYLDSTRFSSWVIASGGDIFDEDTRQFNYNNEGAQIITSFMQDLIESGCAVTSKNREENQLAFGEGSTLFMVDSSFHLPTVEKIVADNADFDWAITLLPSVGGDSPGNIFGASLSISALTPEKQLASWLFLKYYTSPQAQAQWAQSSHYLPVRKSAVSYLDDDLVESENYQAALKLLENGVCEPSLPGYDFIRQEVELALESILEGGDSEAILASLTAAANQILTVRLER